MKLYEQARVVFEPLTHHYILDGDKLLPGVTGVMKDNGLSAEYGTIDPEVLEHAARLGTQAHEAIEDYCNGIASVETPLIKTFRKLGLNVVKTEYLISDCETVASSIDLLAEPEDGVFDIIDMKRTSTIHKDALAWQLGIYRYLFLLANPTAKVRGCYCLPIKKGNKDDILADTCKPLVAIEPVSEDAVKALLLAVKNGLPYLPEEEGEKSADLGLVLTNEEISVYVEKASEMASIKAMLKSLESAVESYNTKIYEYMLERGITQLSTEGGTISLKSPSTRTSLDPARLKKEKPAIYADYLKTTEVKGSISFKPYEQ